MGAFTVGALSTATAAAIMFVAWLIKKLWRWRPTPRIELAPARIVTDSDRIRRRLVYGVPAAATTRSLSESVIVRSDTPYRDMPTPGDGCPRS